MPENCLKIKVTEAGSMNGRPCLLTSSPTFSDLLQVQQEFGASLLPMASAGAWQTSQVLWSSLLRQAMYIFTGYKLVGRKVRIRRGPVLKAKGFGLDHRRS